MSPEWGWAAAARDCRFRELPYPPELNNQHYISVPAFWPDSIPESSACLVLALQPPPVAGPNLGGNRTRALLEAFVKHSPQLFSAIAEFSKFPNGVRDFSRVHLCSLYPIPDMLSPDPHPFC